MRDRPRGTVNNPAMYKATREWEQRSGMDRRVGDSELAEALAYGRMEILFQPQFAAADGKLIGAEALARWHHPLFGCIAGDQLFAIAEQIGRAGPISRRVVGAALEAATAWPDDLQLSINVTAADLAADDFVSAMRQLIATSTFPPDRLTLEITEESLLEDLSRTAERLQLLSEKGVRIALDDFGAGFCNFGYLKRLPLHGLKLDRSMVEGIETPGRDLAVLRAIIAMAGALELYVTVEGIEQPVQLEAAIREGCTYWQGYLGGEPMTADAFNLMAFTLPSAFRLS